MDWHDVEVSIAATPKGERRRQMLVACAAELLLEGGFESVTHRAVASKADLPLASTTYYFDSLDDLIACAVELNGNSEMETMRARVAAMTQRRRGAESTVELLVDLLLGIDDGTVRENRIEDKHADSHEWLVSRYERVIACARHPALRDVQQRLRSQLDDVLTDALRRSGRSAPETHLLRLVAMVDGAMIHALGEYNPDPRGLAKGMLLESIDVMAPQLQG